MDIHFTNTGKRFPVVVDPDDTIDDIKERIPRPQTLPQTLRGKNGLSASSLVLVDSRTIMIKDFTFMGLAPGTF